MQVWRICKRRHLDGAFFGIGGLYAPASWTPQGFKVVYTAESLALASLEVFLHTESSGIPLVAIRAFLPERYCNDDGRGKQITRRLAKYGSLPSFAEYRQAMAARARDTCTQSSILYYSR